MNNVSGQVHVVDYNEKCFAMIGDTKSIKDILKANGSKFCPYLSCGAGWIFSKNRSAKLLEFIKLGQTVTHDQIMAAFAKIKE